MQCLSPAAFQYRKGRPIIYTRTVAVVHARQTSEENIRPGPRSVVIMKKDKVLFLFFTVTSLCYSSRKNPPGLFTDLEASGSGDGDMINPREEGRSGFSSGSGSGSGSGSDSGSGVNPPPAIAKNSSNSCTTFIAPFALVNENDAVLEGRCRSLCIEKVYI